MLELFVLLIALCTPLDECKVYQLPETFLGSRSCVSESNAQDYIAERYQKLSKDFQGKVTVIRWDCFSVATMQEVKDNPEGVDLIFKHEESGDIDYRYGLGTHI